MIRILKKAYVLSLLLAFILLLLLSFVLIVYPPWPLLARLLVIDDRLEKADVIIVLSGDSEREAYAAELYRRGLAPKIIISSCGSAASQLAKRTVNQGVNEQDIIIDDNSDSTYDNSVNSKNLVLARKFKSAIVVTSPYHMRRTKLIFERVFRNTGVKLLYSSTKDSGFNVDGQCKSEVDRQLVRREYLKLVYYWFRYW